MSFNEPEPPASPKTLPGSRLDALVSQRGAFDFLSISLLSDSADCIPLLKTQHTEILDLVDSAIQVMEDQRKSPGDQALEARNLLTVLSSNLAMHLSLEQARLHKVMAQDPRNRSLSSQFERESDSLKASLSGFLKQYPMPSVIMANAQGFIEGLEGFSRLAAGCFKEEELELFASHGRFAATT